MLTLPFGDPYFECAVLPQHLPYMSMVLFSNHPTATVVKWSAIRMAFSGQPLTAGSHGSWPLDHSDKRPQFQTVPPRQTLASAPLHCHPHPISTLPIANNRPEHYDRKIDPGLPGYPGLNGGSAAHYLKILEPWPMSVGSVVEAVPHAILFACLLCTSLAIYSCSFSDHLFVSSDVLPRSHFLTPSVGARADRCLSRHS